MSELPSLFVDDQPEAETEVTANDGPPTESDNTSDSESNTEEKTHEQTETEVDTSSPGESDQGDDTKPDLEQVTIALDDVDYEVALPPEIADRVKNGVMMEHKFRKNSQELADQRRKFEAHTAEVQKRQDEMLSEVAAQLLFAQSELESPEMQQLKEFDRPEYDRRKAEYQDRYDAYKKFVDEKHKELESQQAERTKEHNREQAERLNELLPTWMDKETKTAEAKQVMAYAQELGFQPEEIQGIGQARLVKVFRDAAMYSQAQSNLKAKAKKPAVTGVKASAKPDVAQSKALEDFFYD